LIYARKSVVKTKRDEISPERQVTMCAEAAKVHGWLAETFVDAEGHRSGGSEKHRPEWRRLKAQLGRPDVAAVIVADLARASRSPRDFYNFLDECNKRGVQFISLKQQIDTTTANGRAMLGISLIFAAWEREITSERATVAIGFKREQGKHVGNAPYGTKRDEAGILVESDDWPACRIVLEAYATGKYSIYNLPFFLNAQGLRFRDRAHQPAPFDRYSVRSIISNVLTYAGFIVRGHGKAMTLPFDLDERGDMIVALAERVGAGKGQHAPFISRELAERVVRARRAMMKPHGSQERRDYILVPVLVCAACGEPMRGLLKYGRPIYVHRGRVCMRRARRPDAVAIERQVLDSLATLRLSPEAREDLRRRVEDRLHAAPEHADAVAAMRNLEAKRERMKQLYIEGDIDRAQYDQQKRATSAALDELRGKLDPRPLSLDAVFQELDSLADILAHGTPKEQRRAIADLFERIEVDLTGQISKMVVRDWVRAIFQDCSRLAAVPSVKPA
jgi:site-specific DNA recombinase